LPIIRVSKQTERVFKMKRTEFSVLIGLIIAITITSITAFAKDCQTVRSDVLRLHILANSDSEQDQALKLKIRDAILERSPELFDPTLSLEGAIKSAKENLSELQSVAEEEIFTNGYNYPVTVYLCDMFFETRKYENYTLPAGNYQALRVEIGAAEGKNWWCVLFPTLCIPASQGSATPEEVFSQSELDTVTSPKYEAKFAIVELIERFLK